MPDRNDRRAGELRSIQVADLLEERFAGHVVRVGARKPLGDRLAQFGEKLGPESGHRAVGSPEIHGPRGEQGASVRRQITFPHQLAAIEPVVVGVVGEVVGQPDERTRPCDGSCDAGRVA